MGDFSDPSRSVQIAAINWDLRKIANGLVEGLAVFPRLSAI